ncbi:MAG: NYN domain-containing protein, partial [Nocardiopsaceae bacterium]|nr:NYN domain-containing protein [Nocardiopsaceae bacterium]
MDRCALFVDAGYVLADGAMAVHGTRHRESVSWDFPGLLQFFGSVARDRTGLPLLRAYWYEATPEGRRSAEHDALADLPGLKLRLGRLRPGRREGVEGEIRRDLTALARNQAIADALIISAEEDLAQVVAEVQDLGVRVIAVHITVDGNWTISRSLRQECDDLIELGEAHLRPYAELVAAAEPSQDEEEQYPVAAYAGRPVTNGHGPVGALAQQALPAGSSPAPPAIYTAPVVAEYQRSAQPALNGQSGPQGTAVAAAAMAGEQPPGGEREAPQQPREQAASGPIVQGQGQPEQAQQGQAQQGQAQQGQAGQFQQGQAQQAQASGQFAQGQAQHGQA